MFGKKTDPKTAEEKIEAAIDWIFDERPWYSLIVDDWDVQEFPKDPISEMFGLTATAATDGPNLYFNRKFIEDLPQDDVNTLIEHESGHIFLQHHMRLFKEGDKVEVTPAKNVAADLALNWFIRDDFTSGSKLRQIVCMPGDQKREGALDFSRLPTGKDAEWYYENMPADMKNELNGPKMVIMFGGGSGDGQGGQGGTKSLEDMLKDAKNGKPVIIGGVMPHPSTGGSKAEQDKAQQKWENQVIGGIMAAEGKDPREGQADGEGEGEGKDGNGKPSNKFGSKTQGHVPGNIKQVVEALLPKEKGPDWTHYLRRFHHKNTKVRFSYARPNRRSAYRSDMVLPARFAREASEGIFLVDTSGSMSDEELTRALRETEKVLVAYPSSKITLRQADTYLQKTEMHFTRWDFPIKFPVTWSGRGGTELAQPIAEAAASGRYAWMVIVTDMIWGYKYAKDPGIPTIWLQTKQFTPDVPFGFPVHMEK